MGGVTPLSLPGKGLYPGTETVLVELQIQADQCDFHLGHGTVEQLFTLARVLKILKYSVYCAELFRAGSGTSVIAGP